MASLAPAPPITEIPLELFGGTDSEIDPSDCPEGLSPDNQDMAFLPGSVFVRAGVKRVFNPPLASGVSVLYEKSYVQPNSLPLNLFLTSAGNLYVEDVTNSPGTASPLIGGNVSPGVYAQSVSAFGREYIAFSDLLHGQGVPLQFDGTNLDRVTQDGPGRAPDVTDEIISATIHAAATGLVQYASVGVADITEVGNNVVIDTVNVASGTRPAFTRLKANDQINLSGVGSGYDLTYTVASVFKTVIGPNEHLTIQCIAPVAGLPTLGAGGNVNFPFVEVLTTAAYAPTIGTNQTIAGATDATFDGSWPVRSIESATTFTIVVSFFANAASGGGTVGLAGSISPGIHKVCVSFLTRQGDITRPSPIGSWTAGGGRRAIFANIPIGPSNVVARIISLTGAGGGNFFFIPNNVTLPGSTPVYATVIRDNTTTQATIDFSDNALFAAIPIDVPGNDLFDQIVLGTPMGFFAFASRLMTWGDYDKIENLLNMTFTGGIPASAPFIPLGWTWDNSTGGGLLGGGPWPNALAWRIDGDGTANERGLLSQPACVDEFGDQILVPSTSYFFRAWIVADQPVTTGNLKLEFYSASGGGVLSTAAIPLAQVSQVRGGFYIDSLTSPTLAAPAVVPADTIIRIYAQGLAAGTFIRYTEPQIIFAQNPYRNTLSRVSYVNNPEAFAQTAGNLGAEDDQSPIRCFSLQRNNALLKTAEGVHEFTDNDGEPDTWVVNAVTRAVGAMSLRSADPGKFGSGDAAEDWDIVADQKGLYLFAGGDHWKISQEYQSYWDRINQAAQQTVVIKNDPHLRRVYCAVPLDDATTPSHLLVVDYRELDTAVQIAGAAPLHITLAGMMKSSDLTRKWTRWNLAMNTVELLVRPNNKIELCLGGNFGNIYTLDQTKKTDDDYGQKFPYYDTYGWPSHDQEQQFQLGSGRKDFRTMQMCVTGTGLFSFTPLINSLNNPLPQSSFRQLVSDADQGTALANDLEWTVTFSGNRCFFRVQIDPLPGETDVDFNLKKMVVGLSKGSTAYRRTSWL